MDAIFQNELPPELHAEVRLPGMSPCAVDDWLRVDDAYAGQMAYRAELLAHKRAGVLWMEEAARPAAGELLQKALGLLPSLGFEQAGNVVLCPDGRKVTIDPAEPLLTLGHLVQEDLCILQLRGGVHVLTGAVLCFPASWSLADKVGKPLIAIHEPVEEYDANIARRVERMFNGVKVSKPLQRHNYLTYASSDLHQPKRKCDKGPKPFVRSERQCVLRLPRTDAVVFSIHTWLVNR
jgi:hypothetical protein